MYNTWNLVKRKHSEMPNSSFSQKDVEIISDKPIYTGFFQIKGLTLKHRRFEGGWTETLQRELFDRNPVAAILPYDPVLDRVVLIEQFRVGAYHDKNPWLLELVAGIIDDGESAEAMAYRETKEESGLEILELQKIYEYWVSPGGSTEHLTLFYARVDSENAGGIHGLASENEDIKVHVIEAETAFDLVKNGKINNAATIVALQWLQLNRATIIA